MRAGERSGCWEPRGCRGGCRHGRFKRGQAGLKGNASWTGFCWAAQQAAAQRISGQRSSCAAGRLAQQRFCACCNGRSPGVGRGDPGQETALDRRRRRRVARRPPWQPRRPRQPSRQRHVLCSGTRSVAPRLNLHFLKPHIFKRVPAGLLPTLMSNCFAFQQPQK